MSVISWQKVQGFSGTCLAHRQPEVMISTCVLYGGETLMYAHTVRTLSVLDVLGCAKCLLFVFSRRHYQVKLRPAGVCR
jgi:hypothetical protein